MKKDTDIPTISKSTQTSAKDIILHNPKSDKKDDLNNRFSIYHQDITGLKGKINELLLSLQAEAPHLICLTEHHLKEYELVNTYIPKYKLGAHYCRHNLKQGGVCIFVCDSIKFSNINLLKHNNEQDIEAAVVQLNILKRKLFVICVYRAPLRNFELFLNNLEIILNSVHSHNSELIICGDINIIYLESSNKKDQLDSLLNTYNLTDIVSSPTRITNNSATLIENIFIDNRRSHTIQSCPNGLSDHDGQRLILPKILIPLKSIKLTHTIKLNNHSITDFQNQLSYEQWDNVFGNESTNEIFNNFLNTYLQCYYSTFDKKISRNSCDNNQWITTGIKISCRRKGELFDLWRQNNE